jgi:site-specific DNA-methyltransferase (adenine-specific)
MKDIPDGSIDLVVTDPPYGTMDTDGGRKIGIQGWDKKLPTAPMFAELSRILRPNGKLALFSQEPYTSELITSAVPSLPFSYRAIWKKDSFGNCLGANKNMVSYFEDVLIFSKIHPKHDFKGVHPLRPYFAKILDFIGFASCKDVNNALGHRRAEHAFYINSTQFSLCTEKTYRELIDKFHIDKMPDFIPFEDLQKIDAEYRTDLIERMNTQYPSVFNLWQGGKSKSNILEYSKDNDGFHPTQKPVALLEDLIQTFSNPGDAVLDFTMGSGSTGVACVNTGRSFIGMELDEGYFEIAKKRIQEAQERMTTNNPQTDQSLP